jgi:hypothetical protein
MREYTHHIMGQFHQHLRAAFAPVGLWWSFWRMAYSVEVEGIFLLCVIVKLGIVLLVKLNGTYHHRRMTTSAFVLCAKMLMKLTLDVKKWTKKTSLSLIVGKKQRWVLLRALHIFNNVIFPLLFLLLTFSKKKPLLRLYTLKQNAKNYCELFSWIYTIVIFF